MSALRFVVVLLAAVLVAAAGQPSQPSLPVGVNPKKASAYKDTSGKGVFVCLDKTITVKLSDVNDDYCDCPDGSDEPGTSACVNGEFYCINAQFEPKIIHSSHVNDGVCDCCDGSDEHRAGGLKCPNVCAQKAEEKKKADAESNKVFAEGFAIRQKGIDAAKLSIKEKEKELKEKKEKLVQVTAAIVTAKAVKEALEKAENEALAQFDKEKPESGLDQVLDQVDQEGEQEEAQGSDEPRKYDETDPKYPKEKVEGLFGKVAQTASAVLEKLSGLVGLSVSAAEKSRLTLKELESTEKDLKNSIEELDNLLASDFFGNDLEFYSLYGNCYNYDTIEYTYELCPFKQVNQKNKHGGSTLLGKWSSWKNLPVHTKMEYNHGVKCWNGPERSIIVDITCGTENKVLSVTEPAKCEYNMAFTSPTACDDANGSAKKPTRDEL